MKKISNDLYINFSPKQAEFERKVSVVVLGCRKHGKKTLCDNICQRISKNNNGNT
jgi:translation elongation factor EF-Tu-like GTPase